MHIKLTPSALLLQTISKLRDENTNPNQFRFLLRKLGTFLAYESAKSLSIEEYKVKTPVGEAIGHKISTDIVVLSLLRAAMPMADAVLDEFSNASLGVVSASRDEMIGNDGTSFSIRGGYSKIPEMNGKIVYIVDPMLATGSTIKYLLKLIQESKPKKIILLVAIASKFGIQVIEGEFPDVDIYCGAVDEVLNDHGYIIPGLGDAGDRVCNTNH